MLDRILGDSHYWSSEFQDNQSGCAGIKVHCRCRDSEYVVAEVTYWDASGQFTVKTLTRDVLADIIESAIAEARRVIRVM